MNCRHCGQWNPDPAPRCSFCANPKDGLEDSTVEVRRSQAHPVETRLPESPKDSPLPNPLRVRGPEPEFSRALRLADHVWTILIGIGVVIVGIFYLLGRCS